MHWHVDGAFAVAFVRSSDMLATGRASRNVLLDWPKLGRLNADRQLYFCAFGCAFPVSVHAGNRVLLVRNRVVRQNENKGEFLEGKIKEHGTTSPMFWKLLLSAHWLGRVNPAPYFSPCSAEISRNVLELLDFDRHYRPPITRFSTTPVGGASMRADDESAFRRSAVRCAKCARSGAEKLRSSSVRPGVRHRGTTFALHGR